MKLYIYDHCPYCVKARMIFGYKNIDFEMITLLNDDEETPIRMINQKMLPILSLNPDVHRPESLDIIEEVDKTTPPLFLSDDKTDKQLEDWLQGARAFTYPLAMPRWIKVGLEEFKTQEAVDYFTKKKEDYIGPFSEHLEKTEGYLKQAEEHLNKLEKILPESGNFYLGGQASINDIHLYPTLRSLSVAKGLDFPPKVFAYAKKQEKFSKVPLHTSVAI